MKSNKYVRVSFRSLPKKLRDMIKEQVDRNELEKEASKLKYNPAVRVSSLYYYDESQHK